MQLHKLFILIGLIFSICGGCRYPLTDGTVTFTQSPVDIEIIDTVIPLGNLNPPGHTFPTDHIYFYIKATAPDPYEIKAIADGTIIRINKKLNDYALTIRYTSTFSSYFDHVKTLAPDILNETGFLNDGNNTVYVNIEAGTLSGNWFLTGTPVQGGADYIYRENHLAFVYDPIDPSQIRISCGGTLSLSPGYFSIAGNSPDPKDITVASGMMKYVLQTGVPSSIFLVEMINNTTIKVEVFPDKAPGDVNDFTANVQIYER